ncbi:MAG TPA: RNA 2',3'-cyclic phosphodiesterase [Candidatus Bathyarchaeia archaeon]
MSSGQTRSFVSIDVDDARVLSEIGSVASTLLSLGGDLKPVERENIHLTLKFLGNVDSARIEEIKLALSKVKFSPFQVEIKGAGAFPSLSRMSVIWVGIAEGWTQVQQVYEQTETLFSGFGFPRETRSFSPHITIARVKTGRRRDEIASFLRRLEDKSFGTFTADKVRLKRSVLSGSGPRYSTLLEVEAQTM